MAVDEPKPDPIAEEAKRLHEAWQASSKPAPAGDPAATPSYWSTLREPEAPPTGRRIGWLFVIIVAGLILSFGCYLGLVDTSGLDPNDGGWGEIAFVISPILAVLAGFAIALVMFVVRLFRLADISRSQAGAALIGGGCLGPIAYFVLVVLGASIFDASLRAGRGYLFVFTLPIFTGVGFALGAALRERWPSLYPRPGVEIAPTPSDQTGE